MRYIKLFENYKKKTRTELFSMYEIVDIYLKKCNNWDLNSTKQLYRSTNSANDTFYINTNKHENRKSRNGAGFYHKLLNIIPSWRKAPRRDKSLIMSTSMSYADAFDDRLYVIIPYNNTELAMCNSKDIWISGKRISTIMNSSKFTWGDDIEIELYIFLKNNCSDKHISSDKKYFREYFNEVNINEMIDYIDNIHKDKLISTDDDGDELFIINKWLENYSNMNFREFLYYFFDFDANDFKIINKQSSLRENVEVWASGEFIGIHIDKLSEFKKELNKFG